MPIGDTSFDNTFTFNNNPHQRVGFDSVPSRSGVLQLLIILIVLITALGLSIYVLFENGVGPPEVYRSIDDIRPGQGVYSAPCFDNPGLSKPGFNETLRGRQPIAGELPGLRFEDYCHVPVF